MTPAQGITLTLTPEITGYLQDAARHLKAADYALTEGDQQQAALEERIFALHAAALVSALLDALEQPHNTPG